MNDSTLDREDRVLDDLCEQLQHREGHVVRVRRRPDREDRRNKAVDALIERGAETWAVEHTRVFDRPNQLGLSHRLDPLRPIIEGSVSAAFPHHLVGIAVPVEEVPSGLAGERAARLISEAAITRLPHVPVGKAWLLEVPGFVVHPAVIHFAHNVSEGRCWAEPRTPENDDELRVNDVRRALEEKRAKVEAMRAKGHRTMLILDAEGKLVAPGMRAAFEKAMTDEIRGVYDEVYLAASAWLPPDPVEFTMLKGERRAPLDPESDEFLELWLWLREVRRAAR